MSRNASAILMNIFLNASVTDIVPLTIPLKDSWNDEPNVLLNVTTAVPALFNSINFLSRVSISLLTTVNESAKAVVSAIIFLNASICSSLASSPVSSLNSFNFCFNNYVFLIL